MKSPFPGMDPYLEQHWGDVHSRLVLYSCDQLQSRLPQALVARVEERVVVEPEGEPDRSIYPDVRVVEDRRKATATQIAETDIAVAEPEVIEYLGPFTETYINIFEPGTKNRLVTVIEFLSLSNKLAGETQDQYRQKQWELKAAKVSLVEVDLLRAGKRVLSIPNSKLPRRLRTTYQVCVRRGWHATACEIYRAPLQNRLPAIRVPLRKKDEDVRLDLQAVVDQAYANGAYGATIDYRELPDPPLDAADAAWAEEFLQKGRKKR